jgi:hypothetical protein
MALNKLASARRRVDSHIISQALPRFSKLEMIMVGRNLRLEGRPVRHSWRAPILSTYACPSGHCEKIPDHYTLPVVFQTVTSVMDSANVGKSIRLCLGVSVYDQDHILIIRNPTMWGATNQALRHLKQLQVDLDICSDGLLGRYVQPLFQHSAIEVLDVRYPSSDPSSDPEKHWEHMLPFDDTLRNNALMRVRCET